MAGSPIFQEVYFYLVIIVCTAYIFNRSLTYYKTNFIGIVMRLTVSTQFVRVIKFLSFTFFIVYGLNFQCASPTDFDLIIRNARIVDGTGSPAYSADIAVRDGIIAEIGALPDASAGTIIDAEGKTASPGFIDMMGGSSVPLLRDPVTAESKLRQGITTMLVGEGTSVAPRLPENANNEYAGLDITWNTYEDYFPLLEKKGIALNILHTVGSSQVRRIVVGEEDREATPEELARMKKLVSEAVKDGAVGLSTALIYPPGSYASTEEIIELARSASEYGGIYLSHMRNESRGLLEAIDEVIRISREAGIPGHIYHLKAAGRENWPRMAEAVQQISDARGEGLAITADIYPYIRNGIGLGSFIHPGRYARGEDVLFGQLNNAAVRRDIKQEIETTNDWENWYRHTGNDWDKVLITRVRDEQYGDVVGLSVAEVAEVRGLDSWDMFFELVPAGAGVVPESMNEEQKHLAMKAPFICFDNDASPINPDSALSAHPRAFGAFPRVLAKYVRDENIISLVEAVHKLSALPARILKLEDRGQIKIGYAADIILFDLDKVQDKATYLEPLRYSEGIDYVIVNGQMVIDNGRSTGLRPGTVIRHGR
jgi:N-acyl-D-amino-acid deacylase